MAEEALVDGARLVLGYGERECRYCLRGIQDKDPGEEEGEAAETNLAS